jgi:hypothetical protein
MDPHSASAIVEGLNKDGIHAGGSPCWCGDSRLGCPSLGEGRRHERNTRVGTDAFIRATPNIFEIADPLILIA